MIKLKELTDFFSVVIARSDIETGNLSNTLGMLNRLFDDKETIKAFCERVSISVDGYNHDPRELWEIPEVNKFIRSLDREFPFWFYFLNKKDTGLKMIGYCCMETRKITETKIEIDKISQEHFLDFHFLGLNKIDDIINMPIEENETLTNNVIEYFYGPL